MKRRLLERTKHFFYNYPHYFFGFGRKNVEITSLRKIEKKRKTSVPKSEKKLASENEE